MLVPICALLLTQGLPNTIDPPRADPRMILTQPSKPRMEYVRFLRVPHDERRASFDRRSPQSRSAIMREHLDHVIRKCLGMLTHAEHEALSDVWQAATPEAYRGDEKARAELDSAEEHMRKTLRSSVLKDVQELLSAVASKSRRSGQADGPFADSQG